MRKLLASIAAAAMLALCACNPPDVDPQILTKNDTVSDDIMVNVDVMLPFLSPDATDLKLHLSSDDESKDIEIPIKDFDHNSYKIELKEKSYDMSVEMPVNPDKSTYSTDKLDKTIDVAQIASVTDNPSILIEGDIVRPNE